MFPTAISLYLSRDKTGLHLYLALWPTKSGDSEIYNSLLLRKLKSFTFSKIDLYVFRRKDTLLDCLTAAKEDV